MKSTLRAALLAVLVATAVLAACAPQEPAAPAAEEESAPTPAAEESPATHADDFESGDTSQWSAEGSEEEPEDGAPAEDPPADE